MSTARAQAPSFAPYTLMPLPYAESALEPVMSAKTLQFHHGKHHKTYVETLNKLIANDALNGLPLEEVVRRAHRDPAKTLIFNNAGQVWNHEFFWKSLAPKGGGKPTGKLAEMIESSFGGYDEFKKAFADIGVKQFGSGWAWLCFEGGKLTLKKTGNAETPILDPKVKPLLTIDVWEHAYYLDYQNKRPDFLAAVIDKLLNWRFAEENLG
jgi:Fe-Mn family superoxide dismutase